MPQVIALALLGAGLYAGYRWVTRATREIADQMQRTDEALRQEANAGRIEKNLGALEYDPVIGRLSPRAPRLRLSAWDERGGLLLRFLDAR